MEPKNHKSMLIEKTWYVLLKTPPNSGRIASLSKPRVRVRINSGLKILQMSSVHPKKAQKFFLKDIAFSNKTKSHLLVSPRAVHSLIQKLKKRCSSGVDSISSRQLQLAGFLIEQHLAQLFLIILFCVVVPMQFCVEQITSILKKAEKDSSLGSSYQSITILCTNFKLFESFLVRDTEEKYSALPR